MILNSVLSERRFFMRTAICDDVYPEIKQIEDYLLNEGDTVDYYENGKTLLSAYESQGTRYDVIFLDMELDGETKGFDIANAVKAIDDTVLIIFVTSYHQYVFECFQCDPVWFLRKPINGEELEKAYKHTKNLLAQRKWTFTFNDSHKTIRLRSDDILYFESQNHNIIIYTKNGNTYTIRNTMKELEKTLSDSFCRIHMSYIINLQYVINIEYENKQALVTLEYAKHRLPVSRRYKPILESAFMDFKEKEFIG